jgi:two-component system sensor histidine kinase AtoS
LISAPIGEPHALIGLVAIAGSDPDSYNISRQAAEVLAIVVNSLYQEHAWAIKNRSELQAQQYEHCINATIEQHMREGAILVSPSMHILRLNVAAEAILGYSNRQVVRQPVEKILIGTETLLPALDTAQSGSATNNLENLRLFRRNGESFLATVRVYPVINGDQVQAILVLVQDLSEQEQYRMQTQHLEQRAILGEITAIFAHEIRNPINNISTGLQVLAMNLPEGDQNQESIDRLLQDCDRLNDLIKSVLASSKPMDYEMETLDMPAVLNRLLENLKPRFSRLNIEHSLQVEPNCPQIKGNLRALEQVFTNLINNALQQMSEKGGNLTVKIQSTGEPDGKEFLEVSIADTGPGIPKEEQEKIFQPFFTTKRDGTGLGLAIVKRIVSAHNGNVGVTSVPGGTAFHVRFPVTCE